MSKDISVIIPNYNCRDFLPKAINSVLQQTGFNIEILIIDDGSDDGSLEWLEYAERAYNQVRVIRQERKGVVSARNTAIQKANSEYIAFLDADDYWLPNKLEPQLKYMRTHKSCVLSFTNYQHVDLDYQPIIDCFSFWPEFAKQYTSAGLEYKAIHEPLNVLLQANVIGTSAVIVRRDAIIKAGGFDPTLRSASDWDCWLRLALCGEVAFSEQITMDYLMRPNSITANRINRLEAMDEIIHRMGEHPSVTAKTKQRAHALLTEFYGEYYRELGEKNKAFMHALRALYLHPHRRNVKNVLHDIKSFMSFKAQQHIIN